MCKKGTLELWIKSGETVVGMECMLYLKDKIEAQNWNYRLPPNVKKDLH